jgi:hypothetical protein
MKTTFVRTLLVLGAVLTAAMAPSQANAAQCSTASTAGNWAYTYTGTIFTPAGPLPAASVGRFHQSAGGGPLRQSEPQCRWPIRGGGHLGHSIRQ